MANKETPLVYKTEFAVTNEQNEEVRYELIVIKFSNSWQLFLTFSRNISTWLCSSADLSQLDIYSVKVLLGDRTKEHLLVYGRTFIKVLCDVLKKSKEYDRYSISNDLILITALDIKDDDSSTLKQLVECTESVLIKLISSF